jgi:pyruvate carboxylase
MTGMVTLAVKDGDNVEAGQQIGTIEAMKMESAISAPCAGVVEKIVPSGTNVEPGDLLVAITP